jgi:hypothetical protein
VESEQLTLLSGHSMAAWRGVVGERLAEEAVGCTPVIAEPPASVVQVLDLVGLAAEHPSSLADLEHPVTAYLNGLTPSSRRPQLAALEAIARRSTQVFTAETMPWQLLRRPHALKFGACSRRTTCLQPLTACSQRYAVCSTSAGTQGYWAPRSTTSRSTWIPSAATLSPAAETSLPLSYGASSRPALGPPRRAGTARTPRPGAGATPPS